MQIALVRGSPRANSPFSVPSAITRSKRLTNGVSASRASLRSSGSTSSLFNGEVHHWAAALIRLLMRGISSYLEQSVEILGGRFPSLERLQAPIAYARHRVLESFPRQRIAALEMPVNPALLQPHRPHDFRHGRDQITMSVEQVGRAGHN